MIKNLQTLLLLIIALLLLAIHTAVSELEFDCTHPDDRQQYLPNSSFEIDYANVAKKGVVR